MLPREITRNPPPRPPHLSLSFSFFRLFSLRLAIVQQA